ncbi:MAG: hypothetical protein K0R14_701 [Burkholderiales bacterium]|jgi:hypothetical protein|nr:hypothetical protein [Burkholderiales bacterium]
MLHTNWRIGLLVVLLLLFLVSWISMALSCMLVAYSVRKSIEKKYKEELHFWPLVFAMEWTFAIKYTYLAGYIVFNYLDVKNIVKTNRYKTSVYNPLIKFKNRYNVLEEKKINLIICFIHFFSAAIWLISMLGMILIGMLCSI